MRKGRAMLIIVRGLPGSGKSTLTKALSNNGIPSPTLVLDPDKVNKHSAEFCDHIKKQPTNLPEKTLIYRMLLYQTIEALKEDVTVLWEQAWSWREGIEITIEKISRALCEQEQPIILIFELVLCINTAQKRVEERFRQGKHPLSGIQFRKLFLNGIEPCEDLGLKTLRLDATLPAEELVALARNFIKEVTEELR